MESFISQKTAEETPQSFGGLLDASGEVDLQHARTSMAGIEAPPPGWWQAGLQHVADIDELEQQAPKGSHFNDAAWAYYCHSGRWSDGMGVPCQSLHHVLLCCCPFLWPCRLFLTLR